MQLGCRTLPRPLSLTQLDVGSLCAACKASLLIAGCSQADSSGVSCSGPAEHA